MTATTLSTGRLKREMSKHLVKYLEYRLAQNSVDVDGESLSRGVNSEHSALRVLPAHPAEFLLPRLCCLGPGCLLHTPLSERLLSISQPLDLFQGLTRLQGQYDLGAGRKQEA